MDLSRQISRGSPEESGDRHSAVVDTEQTAPLNAQPPCDVAGAACLESSASRSQACAVQDHSVIELLWLAESFKLIDSNC